jgi:hypothetical protein
MYILQIRRMCLSLLLLISHASAAQVETVTAAADPRPVLLITGASYAASWEAPVLPGYRTLNRGVGGQETSQVQARFAADLDAVRPAAVLIWGHVNNIFRAPDGALDAAKERAEGDFQSMVAQAQARGLKVFVATEVTMGPPSAWGDRLSTFINGLRGKETYRGYINRHVREVNAALRAQAARSGVTVLDFEKALDAGDGYRRREFAQEDGSHLTPAAYAELTKFTAAQLARR